MLKSLSKIDFDRFLQMLDRDRGQAAEKYIALRERLEKFFEWRDCENTEELADIVFDRVIKKILEGENIENAEAYSISVAKFVLMENRRDSLRKEEFDENSLKNISENISEEDELKDKKFDCLNKCLADFPEDKRKLLIEYFDTEEETMIPKRKSLAEKSGLNLNTLRIRISRLKTKLEKCTKECWEKAT